MKLIPGEKTQAQTEKNMLKNYAGLCKIKISLFSTLSAATGYIMAGHNIHADMLPVLAGVFLLACGACALNQYQERSTDALMERTKSRPLPSGAITPATALRFSVMLLLSGFFILLIQGHTASSVLGAAAVFWYNGVYTYLKRMTAFASVPGAVVGAIPPAMGWSAAGGDLLDVKLTALCAFFFIWQVPHFWLFFLSYSDDYKRAGLPTIGDIFSKGQISRITSVWILSTAAAGLVLPLYIISSHNILYAVLFAACLWLMMGSVFVMRQGSQPFPFSTAFNRINLYMLLSMLVMNGERFM